MAKEKSPSVKAAHEILRGRSLEPRETLSLTAKLKEEKQFGLSRRLLARARLEPSLNDDPKLRLKVYQQLALCTYKDPDLQAAARLDRAFEILRQSCEDINTTNNQETLGITGAIYKRKWELDNQRQHLERALNYYQRGYEQGPSNDQGYTGINAAFILDLLASQEEREANTANVACEVGAKRREEATAIRSEVIKQVAPLIDRKDADWLQGKWWFYSTVAEAYFGMGKYDKAMEWLERGRDDAKARKTLVPAWEFESTARQLASLARLRDGGEVDAALAALQKFFGTNALESAYLGKVGLALSGGGFRAALFHIGVLARLAELDVLRHVEVLSCVSGGSIIGAHYYLEVRKLLQTTPDKDIQRGHYIDIVTKIRKDFLAGVQKNVRVRVAAELTTNLKMMFVPGFTRTMRAGELYESEIFSLAGDKDKKAEDKKDDPCWLNGLYISPVGDDGEPDKGFNLKTDNWRRRAKVPNLILNATTLNTGHNWQFTASWMGEPPSGIDNEIDGNDRLRRFYYDADDTPEAYREVRLGHAVAASACVPGVFEPLTLSALYPERTVRLVDGGVCDNQGVASLLDQDCNVMLVSDGSGQMASQNEPSIGVLGAPLRSNSILQSRVREAQYQDLSARKRASLLRGFMFVHLKDDLDVDPIDWIGCLDPFDASDDARPARRRGPLTRYGIAKDIQKLLAGVRTDLDSFTDVEAFALMTSGYRMTEHAFKFSKCVQGFPEPGAQHEWDFLEVEAGMQGSGFKYDFLRKQLSVSSAAAFKVWRLSTPLRVLSWVLAAAAAVLAIAVCFAYGSTVVVDAITLWDIGRYIASSIVVALATYVIGKELMRVSRLRETLTLMAIAAGCILAAVAARAHLHIFDPLFLKLGSIEAFKQQKP